MEVLCDELQRASRFRCTTPGQSHERNLKNCTTKCQGLGSAFGVSSPPPALQASVAPPCLWHPALAAAPRSAGGSGLCSAVSMGTSAPRWVWGAGCLWGDVGEGWIPHLLLHPLPLLLDLLLQDFTELLHLLLVLSHASEGGWEVRRVRTVPCGCGCGDTAWPTRPTESTEVPSPSRVVAGTLAMGCVTADGAQPQTWAQHESSAPMFLPPWVPLPGRDSLVEGLLQGLLLAPGFLDAVPHLGQEILQVAQELGLILPQLGPELPDLLPAGREQQGSKNRWIIWGFLSLGLCGPGVGRAPAPGTKAAPALPTWAPNWGKLCPVPSCGTPRGALLTLPICHPLPVAP